MSCIQTVTGRIMPDEMLFCHCHEHVMISKGKSYEINSDLCIDDYEKSLAELKSFANAGGTTIVDAQPVGCGRMAEQLVKLSAASGVRIIASTGFHKMVFYPEDHWIFQYGYEELLEVFLHEIQTGMYIDCDTKAPVWYIGAKAGIIKCALDAPGLGGQYGKLFKAASKAADITGVPLMVHIEQGADPLMLADYLEERHMNLNKVIFCHMDRACPDLDVHREVCRRGISLEYDTIGRPKYHGDKREAEIFHELIQSGYEDRLLFSLDTTRARLKAYTPGGPGLNYIIDTFIPMLKKQGVTERQIEKIACSNCRRVLAVSWQAYEERS